MALSRDSVCTDGMDREDSYPDQSCTMANHHQSTMAGPDWDDLCSSTSICSQSSDEEMKPMGHSKGELYPPSGDTRDYPPEVVNILPHSGPSAGVGPPVERGGPPISGRESTYIRSLEQSFVERLKGALNNCRCEHNYFFKSQFNHST